ncbi:hypothetical protein BEL04_08260 [Mucilaginibacter sp. PPCGB 2223]|uniref:transposase n=1 Tax=Mucilaginibacter sp. PPCGB 2223 TaxID=1886027 RepID=UPI000824DE1E|nr:transposase [Mucilaginibacter sp. PPCGB 2223]OCX54240.1 hypothetical protein BEL04_08260 [Mucilaginibacter sp. PPCGB 2223]
MKRYTYFVGTDVSRNKLDHAVKKNDTLLFHKETANNSTAIGDFISELKALEGFKIGKTLFCIEDTGFYSNHMLNGLRKVKANFISESSTKIRNSMGNVRNKSDKIDAIRIAEYAFRFQDKVTLWKPKRPIIAQLAYLNTLRERMSGLHLTIKMPLKEQSSFMKKTDCIKCESLCNASIQATKADIERIEKAISTLVESDSSINHLMKVITSIPAVGPVTALNIIIATNEFKDINNPKKFACYSGVAPFVKESGKFKGKPRVSHMANKRLKGLLHLCAMVAKKVVPEIAAYYKRKTGEGKNPMSVLNAIRNKLIMRIFACVNKNKSYTNFCPVPSN